MVSYVCQCLLKARIHDLEERHQHLLRRLQKIGGLSPDKDESALRFAARLQRMANEEPHVIRTVLTERK